MVTIRISDSYAPLDFSGVKFRADYTKVLETINGGPRPRACKRSNTDIKDPVVPVRVGCIMETLK